MIDELDLGINSWMQYGKLEQLEGSNGNVRFVDIPNFVSLNLRKKRTGDIEYIVKDGDSLDKLASEYYGEKFLDWVIALRNNMDFPEVQMFPNRKIIIPDPSYIEVEIKR